MSGDGEESPGGAPWLAPESERDQQLSAIEALSIDGAPDASPIVASSARPVSQLMASLSLSHDAEEESETIMPGRSISFADGLSSLATVASSSEAASLSLSPARSSAAGAAEPTSSSCSPNRNHHQQSWPGFADNVFGSPTRSSAAGDNWVQAIDRAISEMVRFSFRERRKRNKVEKVKKSQLVLTSSKNPKNPKTGRPLHAPRRP